MSDATGKLVRWRLRLSELEFDVLHRARIKHHAADALFRLSTTGTDETKLDDELLVRLFETVFETITVQG